MGARGPGRPGPRGRWAGPENEARVHQRDRTFAQHLLQRPALVCPRLLDERWWCTDGTLKLWLSISTVLSTTVCLPAQPVSPWRSVHPAHAPPSALHSSNQARALYSTLCSLLGAPTHSARRRSCPIQCTATPPRSCGRGCCARCRACGCTAWWRGRSARARWTRRAGRTRGGTASTGSWARGGRLTRWRR